MSTRFVSHLTEGGIQNQFDEETIVPQSQAGTSDNDSSSKTTDKEVLDELKFLNLNREYSSNDISIDIPKDPPLDEYSSLTLEDTEEIQQATPSNNDRPCKIMDWGLLRELQFRSLEGEYSRSDPRIMLQNVGDSKGYNSKPKDLSIGPIHAHNPYLFKKELKHKLAAQFLRQLEEPLPSSVQLEKIAVDVVHLYNKKSLRDFYDKEVTASYTDDELMELLFLDGCALLGFIDCYMHKTLNMLNICNAQAALIQNDLFSLENQIPFQVLFVLLKKYSLGLDSYLDFCRFITLMCTFDGDFEDLIVLDLIQMHRPVHILDLLREVIVLGDTVFSNPCGNMVTNCLDFFINVFSYLCCCGERLLDCVAECLEKLQGRSRYQNHYSFGNVQKLKKAGIEFKPSDSLTTISFHSSCLITVQLKLPTLVVDTSTAHKLYNLVMYEMSLPQSDSNYKPWVTSYVHFLDLLIDTEEDVKDLRAADILRNCLESDAEVAHMINSLGSNIVTPAIDAYAVVKNMLEKHYRNRSRRKCYFWRRKCSFWIAQVRLTHFSSPWTILALFAAITILALTAVQTYYAVNPKK